MVEEKGMIIWIVRRSIKSGRYLLSLLILSLLFNAENGFSEGIKQLMPDSNVSAAGLYIYNSGSAYTNFAKVGCTPKFKKNELDGFK